MGLTPGTSVESVQIIAVLALAILAARTALPRESRERLIGPTGKSVAPCDGNHCRRELQRLGFYQNSAIAGKKLSLS